MNLTTDHQIPTFGNKSIQFWLHRLKMRKILVQWINNLAFYNWQAETQLPHFSRLLWSCGSKYHAAPTNEIHRNAGKDGDALPRLPPSIFCIMTFRANGPSWCHAILESLQYKTRQKFLQRASLQKSRRLKFMDCSLRPTCLLRADRSFRHY